MSDLEIGDLFRSLVRHEPWSLDTCRVGPDGIEILGWALPPGGVHGEATFTINGEPFPEIAYPEKREDVGGFLWFWPGAEWSGFRCRAPLEMLQDGRATLQFARRRSGKAVYEAHTHFACAPEVDQAPFPPPEKRRRVHGNEIEDSFRVEGYSTFQKLARALRDTLGRDIREFRRVLDWGCGCGRVTRHISAIPEIEVTGVDIDSDNVAWCHQNLSGTFAPIPLRPPTDLPGESFDLAIGISVFTHLAEADQFRWLAELARLMRPGGILLMTTHGGASLARSGLRSPKTVQLWREVGFFDLGRSGDLEEFISDEDYYRNVFHTHDYIRRYWSLDFEVIEIISECVGNHQDLVVLRRNDASP